MRYIADASTQLSGGAVVNDIEAQFKQPRTAEPVQVPIMTVTPPRYGQSVNGVLGGNVDLNTGELLRVFPGSDLNRYGIHAGDRVISINDHPMEGSTLVHECVGPVGSTMPMTFIHDGRITPLVITRTDARVYIPYQALITGTPNPNHFKEVAAQNRQWREVNNAPH